MALTQKETAFTVRGHFPVASAASRPAAPEEDFRRAVASASNAYSEGRITDEEWDVLVKHLAAALVRAKLHAIIRKSDTQWLRMGNAIRKHS